MTIALCIFGFFLAYPSAIGMYVIYDYARESKISGSWMPNEYKSRFRSGF